MCGQCESERTLCVATTMTISDSVWDTYTLGMLGTLFPLCCPVLGMEYTRGDVEYPTIATGAAVCGYMASYTHQEENVQGMTRGVHRPSLLPLYPSLVHSPYFHSDFCTEVEMEIGTGYKATDGLGMSL